MRKEKFSLAWASAISAVSGCSMGSWDVDEDSIDTSFKLKTTSGQRRSPQLDVQMKCTAHSELTAYDPINFQFPIPIKNYRELIDLNYCVHRILVVVLVPDDLSTWVQDRSESEIALLRCAYWCSLAGLPTSTNNSNVTISIPRSQIFNVNALTGILSRIQSGGMP